LKIIDAIERQPVVVPIKDVMTSDGAFCFVPEVREKGYFDIDYRKNELVLIAGNYIGQVPLTENIIINVAPKVPITNLARIIGIASQPIKCLDFFRRKYKLHGAASSNILEAMCRSLLISLRELDAEGVYRQYELKNNSYSRLRGRIDIARYVRESIPKAKRTTIPCFYYDLSIDTLFNRVIKRAIHEVGFSLSQSVDKKSDLLRQLSYFSDIFNAVPLDNSYSLLRRAKEQLMGQHVPDLRHYYLDILDVCFIILDGSGVELIGQKGTTGMHSLVVNLEDAFEQYLRLTLQNSTVLKTAEINILDGNLEGKSTLFFDNDRFDAKPDLIVKRNGLVKLVGDVKYKTKLAESDRYQLISHALSYGATTAFFVTPAQNDKNTGPVFVGTIGQAHPIKIFHYRINLDVDLVAEESNFINWVTASCG